MLDSLFTPLCLQTGWESSLSAYSAGALTSHEVEGLKVRHPHGEKEVDSEMEIGPLSQCPCSHLRTSTFPHLHTSTPPHLQAVMGLFLKRAVPALSTHYISFKKEEGVSSFLMLLEVRDNSG